MVRRVEAIREDILRRAAESDWVIDESLLTDQAIIRRMVLKRCIYGVDKNPLTVELAVSSQQLSKARRLAPPDDSQSGGHPWTAGSKPSAY